MAIPPIFILGRGHPQIGTTEGTMVSIYALSADENGPVLAAPRRAITVLFSCRL